MRSAIGLHVDELTSRRDPVSPRRALLPLPAPARAGRGRHRLRLAGDRPRGVRRDPLRVTARGLPVREGTPDECALRGWSGSGGFAGPKGVATEIFTAPVRSADPLRMTASGFVTGISGMGHVAITSEDMRGCTATTRPCSTPGCPTSSSADRADEAAHPLPAGQRAPPLGRHRERAPGAGRPDPHPGAARQPPGRDARRHGGFVGGSPPRGSG